MINYALDSSFSLISKLVFETPREELEKIIPIIKKNMSDVSRSEYHVFSIPLTVDINSGNNWDEAH